MTPFSEARDIIGRADHTSQRAGRVVRDGLRVELGVLLLERLKYAHADGQAELQHGEQAQFHYTRDTDILFSVRDRGVYLRTAVPKVRAIHNRNDKR